jgi:SecD/SecF fusion protein
MLRFTKSKIALTLGIVLLGLVLALPSFFSKEDRQAYIRAVPSWVPSWLVPQRAIVLGLDLQGGVDVTLEVDRPDLILTQTRQLTDEVRRTLRESNATAQGGIQRTPRGVQFRIPDEATRARALPKIRELSQPITSAILGQTGARTLDISEGPDGLIQLNLTDAGLIDKTRRAVDQGIEVVRRRLDPQGILELSIQRQGAERITVQIPGADNPDAVREALKPYKLEFRLLGDAGSADTEQLPSRDQGGQRVPVERRVIVTGADLTDASPGFDQRTNEPIVNFKFTFKGGQSFAEATTQNVGRALAIVLDNEVISAPRILQPITGGQGQISGRFTVEDVNKLSVALKSGALPAKFTIVDARVVGPGLGRDQIEAGKWATIYATLFVVIYMFWTYGVFGFIANIALIVHVGLIFGLMSVLEATMTLPGIAGIVLTIGTAVDSNVLIYERIREEAKAGRSVVSAIQAGFERAFATIVDSNSTMAIAALILFFVGSGPVRGFAVVFILGILTTVITAVTMTRMMIALWYKWARPKTIPF